MCRYFGMENADAFAAWVSVALVLIVFLVIMSADGYNQQWTYDQSSNSPVMALWVLLIACGGLFLISLCACCMCYVWQQQQQYDNSV